MTKKDLEAAKREAEGEIVKVKKNGKPWDHVDEVENSQRGLLNRIEKINKILRDPKTSPEDRAKLHKELSQASKLLDLSEEYLPRSSE